MKEHTILIVEDEKEIGELVKDYLEREGYQVVLAFDGKEGLHLFYEKKPTLVVLDIMLPEIDGIEGLPHDSHSVQHSHHHDDGKKE